MKPPFRLNGAPATNISAPAKPAAPEPGAAAKKAAQTGEYLVDAGNEVGLVGHDVGELEEAGVDGQAPKRAPALPWPKDGETAGKRPFKL